ncbi:hypothetical protein EO95_09435 [Methanosarcina sp. 1.H.T.1A.1]|uniref:hypothetical protein n=1 Tax=Methanosarcina sp. 1.H.T.1A.1 TaxID=1483602 RepID=UPI0006224D6F|nr:hypothetical protein [Methanosarcina sp. 1.H.T.1A.1]KKH92890.1 hypothetical protein EO95_09435 [Methanosarcina sp. 1.H.T.1A.1]
MVEAKRRLIPEFETLATEYTTDYLTMVACDIEDALLQCGAKPGIDYNYLDLFKMAVEYSKSAPLYKLVEAVKKL